ncbi:hypothetical protein BH11VER1_BH11VER1_27090 [soil metagenome]
MKLLFSILILGTLSASGADDALLIARYLDYQKLPRITERKIDLEESVIQLCLDPKMYYGPHIKPGIQLYVNPTAIEARKKDSAARIYPIGSVLVKEKFATKEASEPDIITVMEKVSMLGGINDWKFTMIRLADRSIVRDGFKVSCVDCHSRFKESDFVSTVTDSLLSEYASKEWHVPTATEPTR